ncbi:MAG: hypothetical protein AAFY14_11380, partial [Pseudomonadota bacterium]
MATFYPSEVCLTGSEEFAGAGAALSSDINSVVWRGNTRGGLTKSDLLSGTSLMTTQFGPIWTLLPIRTLPTMIE